MADDDFYKAGGGYDALREAMRLAMPQDYRNPLLHPEAVNHFALPPKQPRAEIRNPAPRPGDYLSPVSEALSPTMGAYGLGNALGDAYVQGREGNYKGMASPLAEILLGMAPLPGAKVRAFHGTKADIRSFDRPAYFSTDRNYAQKFAGDSGRVYDVDLAPRNPYYTSNQMLVEGLRSFPERAQEFRDKGHDAVILSGATDGVEPILGLGGLIQPQIYALDPAIVSKLPPRVENPIKAYHGSPHDFDRFDLSKIGTGEGAQAFGHGLYMAENESVARSYRRFGDHEVDQLTRALQDARDQFKPQDLTAENLRRVAVERFPKLAGLPPQTWQDAAIAANGKLRNGPGISTEAKDAYDRIYARHPKPEGHMYEVAIHASPDQFLDWDKPLSQQSEAVRTALSEIDGIALRGNDIRVNRNGDYAVYERPLEALVAQRGSPEAASAALRDAGVVGIQYLDQGSRGAGAGTMNRVVFDPNLIEILRKYGLLGPVAAGATANALMGDKDQQ